VSTGQSRAPQEAASGWPTSWASTTRTRAAQIPREVFTSIRTYRPNECQAWLPTPAMPSLTGWAGSSRSLSETTSAKLAASGADETHAFVIVPGLTTAPFGVSDLLMRDEAPLPTFDPALPLEVSHVWTVSTWSTGSGFRWSPDEGWSMFDKKVTQTDLPRR
jgi:hypothetical protein